MSQELHYTPSEPASAPTESERDRELRELRARKAELLEAAEAKGKDLELERERRAVKDAEVLQDLVAKHGALDREIAVVDTDFGMVVMQRCSGGRFKRFIDGEKFKSEHLEQFVRPQCIYPTKAEFDDWCERQGGIMLRCSDALARLAGMRKADVEKK